MARVRVSAHTRTSKTGKVVRVQSYFRSVLKMTALDLVSELRQLGNGPDDRFRKVAIEREIAARKRMGKWVDPDLDLPTPPDANPTKTLRERALLAWAKVRELTNLKDNKGPVEKWLRETLAKVGLNPYDVVLDKLHKHADEHARARGVAGNMSGESRFWFKSPCWTIRDIDFAVHQMLPVMLARKHPDLARKLISTSPRWKYISLEDLLAASTPEKTTQRALEKLKVALSALSFR